MTREEAADAACWSIISMMAFGFTADEILHDPEVLNGLQTFANIAAAEGKLHDDDPEGKLASHDVPFTGYA